MKKIVLIIILAIVLTFIVTSCSNRSQKKYSTYNKNETYYGLTKQEMDSLMQEIDKNLQGK